VVAAGHRSGHRHGTEHAGVWWAGTRVQPPTAELQARGGQLVQLVLLAVAQADPGDVPGGQVGLVALVAQLQAGRGGAARSALEPWGPGSWGPQGASRSSTSACCCYGFERKDLLSCARGLPCIAASVHCSPPRPPPTPWRPHTSPSPHLGGVQGTGGQVCGLVSLELQNHCGTAARRARGAEGGGGGGMLVFYNNF